MTMNECCPTVLIIDDDSEIVISRTLKKLGCQVHTLAEARQL